MTCVVLFGGRGTRLKGLHRSNKCFIKIHNKPICYYVVKNLLKSFKKEELVIVTNKGQVEKLANVLIKYFNYHFKIISQSSPLGVSHGANLAIKKTKEPFYLCLGDFFSSEIHKIIKTNKSKNLIILNKVKNPEKYGVFDFKNNIVIEKPKTFISNYAVRGFYKFDYSFSKKFNNTKKSKRNEFEITDVLNQYKHLDTFKIKKVFDLGSKKGIKSFTAYLKK